MRKDHQVQGKSGPRWGSALLLSSLLYFGLGPVGAQPRPAPSATPAPVMTPKPKVDLPPLKLPDIPGEENVPGEEDGKDVPAPPLPPRPIPTGPSIIDANLPSSTNYLYRMEYDGRLVGFSQFQMGGKMSLAGQTSYIIDSRARLKMGVGSPDDSRFESKLIIDSKTLAPSLYKCLQVSKGGQFSVQCIYTNTMVAQTNQSGKIKQDHFHTYEGDTPKLLFNNLWGHWDTFPEHYWLLVRCAVKGGYVTAYDPILRGGGKLIVYAPKAEKWMWEKESVDSLVYPISDMEGTLLAMVRLQAKSLDLLEVREVGRGMVMRRTRNAALMPEVDKIKSLDLLPRRIIPSNVLFSEPEKLTAIEADIDMSLRGGQFADHRIPGYRQYFTGELKEGSMKGRVVVRSVPRETQYQTKYPYRTADKPTAEMVAQYLKPGPGVESDFPPLLNKGMELAWKSENTFAAARKLLNFVSQIEEGVSLPSARYALEAGVGNPESKALLLVAMARAVGLPARRVGGLLFRDNSFVPHHWTEIWLGPSEGWAPFDPTTMEAGRVGASHIALWESGDLQRLELKVTSYAPRAPKKVAYFNRELAWSVGEERVYEIYRDGKKIGEETAGVRELMVRDGDDAYRFESATTLEINEKTISTSSELFVDAKGLPVAYRVKGVKAAENQSFTFKDDTAKLETELSEDKKQVREIPFSNGTYFADQRFLSQWALVVGQVQDSMPNKALKQGDRVNFFIFVPESLKSQEIVLDVKDVQTIKNAKGEDVEALKLEAESGMAFYVTKKNQVVKIAVPQQKLELLLRDVKTKMP